MNTLELNERTAIYWSLKKQEISKVAEQNLNLKIVEFKLFSQILYLALNGFKLMNPPRPARSTGSQALYLASGLNKKLGLLLQYLPANATTSQHYHKKSTEIFYLLYGQAFIVTPEKELQFSKENKLQINPNITHQVKSQNQGSLILLQMKMPEGIGMADHFYV